MFTIENFKNRECKAKDVFYIKQIEKSLALDFVTKYHYLGDAKFFAKFSFGIFLMSDELVGVATFSNPQGNVALKGWFGLENDNQTVLELSRLCVLPILNGSNATSFLLGGSIKLLKQLGIQAVITLADSIRHVGSIYQVCNFEYFGLTDVKSDFYREDGKINPRGATKDSLGVWVSRTRKHRYAYIMDKNLKCLYKSETHPKKDNKTEYSCCNGTNIVIDKRNEKTYICPKCNDCSNGLIIVR